MDLAIQFLHSADNFIFSLPPESVKVTYAGITVPFTSITQGLFKIPAGRNPQAISFDVLLASNCTMSVLGPASVGAIVNAVEAASGGHVVYPEPNDLVQRLNNCITTAKMRCWLLNEELVLNGGTSYLLEGFETTDSGAFGDKDASFTFSEERIPSVSTTDATGALIAVSPQVTATLGPGGASVSGTTSDGTPQWGSPYTTKTGDTLDSIAARLGAGWTGDQIFAYDGNQATLQAGGGTRDNVPAGIILAMPPSGPQPSPSAAPSQPATADAATQTAANNGG